MWSNSDTMSKEWWEEIKALDNLSERLGKHSRNTAPHQNEIHPTAILNASEGPIILGSNVKICEGASLKGPLEIGDNVIVGKNAQIRGPSVIGSNVLLGFNVEVKRSIIGTGTKLGPGSYVGDSFLEKNVFFGALVRTSNYRLDNKTISVLGPNDQWIDTGMDKLGCLVGQSTSLGIGCKIYPGREVPRYSLFEMDVHIKKNLSPGHYRIKQDLEQVD